MRLRGTEYVPNRSFPNDSFPAVIKIGDKVTTLGFDGFPHWATSVNDTGRLLALMKKGDVARIEYAHLAYGKGQRVKVSLSGFSIALNALQGRAMLPAPTRLAVDPIQLIGRLIETTAFGITVADLKQKPNPRGKGTFVFVPQTRFWGMERSFIWFVNGRHASKLNGATNNLTPNLPFPRHADYEIWQDSGLKSSEATQFGLKVVFGW